MVLFICILQVGIGRFMILDEWLFFLFFSFFFFLFFKETYIRLHTRSAASTVDKGNWDETGI